MIHILHVARCWWCNNKKSKGQSGKKISCTGIAKSKMKPKWKDLERKMMLSYAWNFALQNTISDPCFYIYQVYISWPWKLKQFIHIRIANILSLFFFLFSLFLSLRHSLYYSNCSTMKSRYDTAIGAQQRRNRTNEQYGFTGVPGEESSRYSVFLRTKNT